MFKLQDLRDRRQIKALGYAFIILVLISFVLYYGQGKSGNGRQDYHRTIELARLKNPNAGMLEKWDAIDNSRLLEAEESVKQRYRSVLPQNYTQFYDQQKPGQTERLINQMVSKKEAVEELANEKILNAAAEDLGFNVPREQVRNIMLQQMPGINDQYLKAIANREGMTVAQYVEHYRRSLEQAEMLEIAGLAAQSSLFELWQEYSLAHEKLTVRLAGFPSVKFEDQVAASEADLQQYLEEHREEFHKAAERRYAYIKKSGESLTDSIKPTDEDLKAYYEQNQVNYMRSAGFQTEDIYIPLTGDTNSSAAMVLLGAEREEAAKAADWNPFVERLKQKYPKVQIYHRAPSAYYDAKSEERSQIYLDAMTKLEGKNVTQPIVDENGAYLFRVTDRRNEGVTPFESSKEQLLKDYRAANLGQVQTKFYNSLKEELAKGGHTTMQSLAKAVGLEDALTTRVAQNAAYIPEVGNVLREQDHLRSLKLNEFSDVIQQADKSLLVMQVVEENPERDPPLADIRSEVEEALKASRARDLAKKAADDALRLIKGGAPFNATLAEAPIKPVETQPIERTQTIEALEAPLLDFTEQTVGLEQGSRGVSAYGSSKDAIEGYAVWELVKVDPASREQFDKDLPTFRKDYLELQREAIKREWLRTRRQQLDFEILASLDEKEAAAAAPAGTPAATPENPAPATEKTAQP